MKTFYVFFLYYCMSIWDLAVGTCKAWLLGEWQKMCVCASMCVCVWMLLSLLSGVLWTTTPWSWASTERDSQIYNPALASGIWGGWWERRKARALTWSVCNWLCACVIVRQRVPPQVSFYASVPVRLPQCATVCLLLWLLLSGFVCVWVCVCACVRACNYVRTGDSKTSSVTYRQPTSGTQPSVSGFSSF